MTVAVAQGDGHLALVTAAAIGLMVLGPKGVGVAFVGAVVFGAWATAVVAATYLVLVGLGTVTALVRAYDTDVDVLAKAVVDLPPALRPVDDAGVLTTATLLNAARRIRPDWWRTVAPLRQDLDSVSDGPLLTPLPETGLSTQYAAEAISLARLSSETFDVPLDAHLLAAAALLIPDSAAATGIGVGQASDVIQVPSDVLEKGRDAIQELTGAHPFQIGDLLTTFARERGGGDVLRRVELIDREMMRWRDRALTGLLHWLQARRRRNHRRNPYA